jgi:hypothetical protein
MKAVIALAVALGLLLSGVPAMADEHEGITTFDSRYMNDLKLIRPEVVDARPEVGATAEPEVGK